MSLKKCVFVAAATLLLSACSSSRDVTTAGSQVQFVDVKPADSCQFLGQAEGRRNSFFVGSKTHSELIRDAAKDLQNQAAGLGGNTIFNAQDATSKVISSLAPVDVIMVGDIYRCP